jgi:hypothetical protein
MKTGTMRQPRRVNLILNDFTIQTPKHSVPIGEITMPEALTLKFSPCLSLTPTFN